MKKILRRVSLGAVGLLIVLGVLWSTIFKEKPKVDYVSVQRGVVKELVTTSSQGTVKAHRFVSLPIEVTSAVVELSIAEGSEIKAGQLIVAFDDREARITLQTSKAQWMAASAQVAVSKNQLDAAKRELEKGQKLLAQNAVSTGQVDKLLDAVRLAEEQVRLAQANEQASLSAVQQFELRLARHRIVSPVDGILVRLNLQKGEIPSLSATSLGSLASVSTTKTTTTTSTSTTGPIQVLETSSLYIEAELDERDLGRVQLGQKAELRFDALSKTPHLGTLAYIRPMVDVLSDKTRQVTVWIDPPLSLLPQLKLGMSADIEIVTAERNNVSFLPPQVVIKKGGEHQVYLYKDGKVQHQAIKIGSESWQAVELLDGLQVGDKVLWPPEQGELENGQRVDLGVDRTVLVQSEVSPTVAR